MIAMGFTAIEMENFERSENKKNNFFKKFPATSKQSHFPFPGLTSSSYPYFPSAPTKFPMPSKLHDAEMSNTFAFLSPHSIDALSANSEAVTQQMTPREVIRQRDFHILWITFFFNGQAIIYVSTLYKVRF